MRAKSIATLLAFIVCILTIALLTWGGCGIGFGNNGGDGGNVGPDSVQGTITSISNVSSTSGIEVQATDSANTRTDTTDNNGFFQIQGFFSGSSLKLAFVDPNNNNQVLAVTSVTIFPGIQINLGNITITDGNVTLSGNISVTFDGDISTNNCSQNAGNNAGTIVVTAGNTDVIVQVLSSTTIVDSNNNTRNCGDLLSGGTVTVAGDLLMGNTVQANRIELH
ncbi:MAG: hypothetical protein ACM3SR_17215 [Ignavibacteriales bacterium]